MWAWGRFGSVVVSAVGEGDCEGGGAPVVEVGKILGAAGGARADGGVPAGGGQAEADWVGLTAAIALAGRCLASQTAFSVGAVIVGVDGQVLGTGFSRQLGDHWHAEEVALAAVSGDDPRLAEATLYSSMEPCSRRSSRPLSCTDHIVASPIGRVVFAASEPGTFVRCDGAARLRAAGRVVVQVADLAQAACVPNAHLL